MRFKILCLVVLVALQISTAAQRPQQNPQPDIANELWRVRAQTITDDVLTDAYSLNSLRRALVWSKLAEVWWREDPRRAKTWITDAIEVVEQVPNRESAPERGQRLATAKLLLTVASRLDQKLSQRLIAIVGNVNESTSVDDRDSTRRPLLFLRDRSCR
jgi:hypothetical protein